MRSNALFLIFQFEKIHARFEHAHIDALRCLRLKDALTQHVVYHNVFNGFRWQIEVKRIGRRIRIYRYLHICYLRYRKAGRASQEEQGFCLKIGGYGDRFFGSVYSIGC